MSDHPTTPAHEQHESFHEDILYPEHVQRTESSEFRANKHLLVHQLDLGCWICGSKQDREVHHFASEWSLWDSLDPALVLDTVLHIDPYGYAAKDPSTPMSSPDDIRNLMVLCEKHHRHPYFGVHTITMPIWIAQRSVKPGVAVTEDPTAQEEGS